MGSLTLPESGSVYVDANTLIYTIEEHAKYRSLLVPLWQQADLGQFTVVSSELVMLELLVLPIRRGDLELIARYEQAMQGRDRQLIAITSPILRAAAELRARTSSLRTPDAIHAATSMLARCALFVSNDVGLRRVPGLPLVILDDLLGE